MDALGVRLHERFSGREAGCYALPSRTRERLIADAHLSAVVDGRLPNTGRPLTQACVRLRTAGEAAHIEVELAAEDRRYRKRFSERAVYDDVQVIIARMSAAGTLTEKAYLYSLAPAQEEPQPARALELTPAPRVLPRLTERSLGDFGAASPPCAHPAILVPQPQAARLLEHAGRTPEVEVGALLLTEPFLIRDRPPGDLGIVVREVVPLLSGTTGDRSSLRIPPQAFAETPVEAGRGTLRGGLAHSHPFSGNEGSVFFLSVEDRALATAFFYWPHQIQLVIDPQGTRPDRALAAFCWVDGRLGRVCFQLVPDRSEVRDREERAWA